jgi:phosphoglycerate kinase
MAINYLDQLDLSGKRVLIRVDYNVPYDKEMNITDDTRIQATLPTLEYCINAGARIILMSHLGRPKGEVKPEMSLQPVAKRLGEILGRDIRFIDANLADGSAREALSDIKDGEIALLENVRFYKGETKNDPELGERMGELADVYVNDAFATAHRAHASNEAVTHHMETCAAGFLLKNEIEYFRMAMEKPERPLGAVIGGAKVSTKIDALNNIIQRVDFLIIGGAMAFTFLRSKGIDTGSSLVEEELIDTASDIMENALKNNVDILLPLDVMAAESFDNDAMRKTVPVEEIPADMMGLDIGPESVKLFNERIGNAKTIIWNGPLGAFEMPNFAIGTAEVGKVIADSDLISIIGGGDTVTAVNRFNLADKMSYISTGGGAFLELLEGKQLPAFAALDR